MGASDDRQSRPTAPAITSGDTAPERGSADRKTQRMSAKQFQTLLQEGSAEPPRVTTTARLVPRATTVEDPETTAELAALTAAPPGTVAKAEFAFDTSDEPEASAPRERERLATVEMSRDKLARGRSVGRAPLATMELSSDMILQIAVNGPLAVKRPPMATMELTVDMILPERMAQATSGAAMVVTAAAAPAAAHTPARSSARAIEAPATRTTQRSLDMVMLAGVVGLAFELMVLALLLVVRAC